MDNGSTSEPWRSNLEAPLSERVCWFIPAPGQHCDRFKEEEGELQLWGISFRNKTQPHFVEEVPFQNEGWEKVEVLMP